MTALSVLALSPHLDDAAFSAGGTIRRLTAAGHRVRVVTLFTRSMPEPTGFALACQLDKGLPPDLDYMALRRDEDRAACTALGATPHWCDQPEAPHRGYRNATALFAPPHPDDATTTGPALDTLLSTLLADHAPDLVLAPQAIGGHVDHVLLVRALDRLRDPPPIGWWRDFPYVSRRAAPVEPFAPRFHALPDRAVAIDPANKNAACAAYRSQLGYQFGGADGLARALASAGPVEWLRGPAGTIPAALAAVLEPG